MENDARDGAAVRIPPPLAYLGAVIAGILLHLFVLSFPIPASRIARIGLTAAAAFGGVGLIVGAVGLFRRTGQDPKPWKSTPEIVSTGVYRFTRNPMYVAMALLQASIGLGLANGWIVVLVPLSLVIVDRTAVIHEEVYLERKFGDVYRDYKSSVRRWL